MSNILTTILSTRTLSHYAASSSSPALRAVFGFDLANKFLDQNNHLWRSLSQSRCTSLDANNGVQTDQLAPHSSNWPTNNADSAHLGVNSEMTASTSGRADACAAVTLSLASRRRLRHPEVPTAALRDLRPPIRPYQLTPILSQRPTGSPAQYTPWTPTRTLQRRKHITKRMGFLMQILEREQMERVRRARPLPDFRAGDILEIRMMLPEAERKVTIYRGVCIARYHKGIRSSFKIYNVYPECGGVVQHIPLYMPDLLGIKVVGRIPASQERLFYLLERETSDYTFQTGVSAAN